MNKNNMIFAITNVNWAKVYLDILENNVNEDSDYIEAIGLKYKFNPLKDFYMTSNSSLFDIKKAAAMYFWYKNHDSRDASITKYFDEYKHCVDDEHPDFNSNYGIYAYDVEGLDQCVERLVKDPMSRQAMFCINNKEAMSDRSIDKLCTNNIHFFIRNKKLMMIVQMRASNFITLLPYDSFMFSMFYMYVYNKLVAEHNMLLLIGDITMFASTIHFYYSNIEKIKINEGDVWNNYDSLMDGYHDKDFFNVVEKKLKSYLEEK